MRVHDDEKHTRDAHSERDEALFSHGVRVLARERVVVRKYGCRFGKRNTVFPKISSGLIRIPIDIHPLNVWTNVVRVKRLRGLCPRL